MNKDFSPEEVKTLKQIVQEKKNNDLQEASQKNEVVTDNIQYVIDSLQSLIDSYGINIVTDCLANHTTVNHYEVLQPIANWYAHFDDFICDVAYESRNKEDMPLESLIRIMEHTLTLIERKTSIMKEI